MSKLFFFRGLQAKTVGTLSLLLVVLIGGLILMNLVDLHQVFQRELKSSSSMVASNVYHGILHPMAVNDTDAIRKQMQAYGTNMKDFQVLIFGFNHEITYASLKEQIGGDLRRIVASHELSDNLKTLFASGKLSREHFEENRGAVSWFTVVKPMLNEKRCNHCHGASRKVLGGVMVRRDISLLVAGQEALRTRNIIVGVAGILFSIALVWILLSKIVVKPVGWLAEVADHLSQGDLTRHLGMSKRDELGQLADSIDAVTDRLGSVIKDVEGKAGELAEGVSQQAAAIEETAASTEEVSSALQKNADHSREAQSLVGQTIESMKQARESMRILAGNMADTSAASDDVAVIIKSIDEIAFQTNLLALNAAVEAARAGEAGAGFAVVADEVRNLAIRAAEAAEQTEQLISDIVNKIKDSHQLVEAADKEYREVAVRIKKVSSLSAEVAEASAEQAQGIQQVNTAMATVDNVTQNQAAMAHTLAEIMGRFKVDRTSPQNGAPPALKDRPRLEYKPRKW